MSTTRSKAILLLLLTAPLVGASTSSVAERAAPPTTIERPPPAPPSEEVRAPEPKAAPQPDKRKKETRLDAVLRAWAKAQDAASVGEHRFVSTSDDKLFGN